MYTHTYIIHMYLHILNFIYNTYVFIYTELYNITWLYFESIFIYTYIYTHTHIIYIYTYIYVYIYMYIYIYSWIWDWTLQYDVAVLYYIKWLHMYHRKWPYNWPFILSPKKGGVAHFCGTQPKPAHNTHLNPQLSSLLSYPSTLNPKP